MAANRNGSPSIMACVCITSAKQSREIAELGKASLQDEEDHRNAGIESSRSVALLVEQGGLLGVAPRHCLSWWFVAESLISRPVAALVAVD